MTNIRFASIASCTLFCCLFLAFSASAQFIQNNVTKSISTNAAFNAKITANVGIGTASPMQKLTVFTPSNSYGISHTDGNIKFSTYIGGQANGAYVGTISNHPLHFYINNGNAQMTVATNGNVGIGTVAPVSRLEIAGQNALMMRGYEPFLNLRDENCGQTGRIQFVGGAWNFHKILANGNVSYQMTVVDNGNVGIGTTVPKSKLEVVGQDGICSRGYEPFITIIDDNSGKSARIQAAHGDINFFKGVPSGQGWNNYIPQMVIKDNGIVMIGTSKTPVDYKLAVGGKVICEEVKVQLQNAWPDYVFSKNYKLPTIEAVEQHIHEQQHLPGIPSACEVAENGISVGEMQTKMMEKIEELTLYLIEQNKEIKQLKAENLAIKATMGK
ncbi:MAG: hypothetical protein NW218_14215 [Saprospiraceae bacterium]|nr:hypothetical protein [Saprospiraceae bacterium]